MSENPLVSNVRMISHPRIILVCGPARSGTTALSHLFIRTGIKSHMQPLKSMLRSIANDGEIRPWTIGGDGHVAILSKETIGPNEECEFFNPVRILVELGYPKNKILPILLLRNPNQTLASWEDLWGSVRRENFILAYRKMREIADYCDTHDIRHINFIHDQIRHNAESLVHALLKKCGILAEARRAMDWTDTPSFNPETGSNSLVVFYDNPPRKFVKGIGKGNVYSYRGRSVSEETRAFVRAHPELESTYCFFKQRHEREFSDPVGVSG